MQLGSRVDLQSRVSSVRGELAWSLHCSQSCREVPVMTDSAFGAAPVDPSVGSLTSRTPRGPFASGDLRRTRSKQLPPMDRPPWSSSPPDGLSSRPDWMCKRLPTGECWCSMEPWRREPTAASVASGPACRCRGEGIARDGAPTDGGTSRERGSGRVPRSGRRVSGGRPSGRARRWRRRASKGKSPWKERMSRPARAGHRHSSAEQRLEGDRHGSDV